MLRDGPSRWRALEPGWWQWSGRWSRWRCRWWMTVLCVTIKEWVIRNRKRRQGGGQPAVFIEGGLIDTVFLKPTWCHPRRHYHRTKDLGTRITFLTLEQSQHSLSSLPPLICSISMMIIEIKKHNNGWSSPQWSCRQPGIHAREWISPATVTFIMRELLTHPRMSRLTNQVIVERIFMMLI